MVPVQTHADRDSTLTQPLCVAQIPSECSCAVAIRITDLVPSRPHHSEGIVCQRDAFPDVRTRAVSNQYSRLRPFMTHRFTAPPRGQNLHARSTS
ncbi:hypothetical protein NSPZN2_130028 [Nitrospira defluvii]|uniref:Uncharacterized protein n=1 Tax=Nitrospira defluvii TaxID=330214 RepID=A0ABN7LCK4_9BACT|nr:hypothetical protein NSPZN2_130028 [Nitrospira defluvii]